MRISISEQDTTPIYQQITNQVKLLVSCGRLRADEELPSIRALAEQLIVNPNTVARAYRELEVEGIVRKRRAQGCYVSTSAEQIGKDDRLQLLAGKADAILLESAQLGIQLDELFDFLRARNSLQEVNLT